MPPTSTRTRDGAELKPNPVSEVLQLLIVVLQIRLRSSVGFQARSFLVVLRRPLLFTRPRTFLWEPLESSYVFQVIWLEMHQGFPL